MEKRRVNVLVIEDNPDFIYTLERRFSMSKDIIFSMKSKPNLSEGLKCLKEGGIDVILLDLNLSDSNGLETLKRMHAQAKNLAIIVVTGQYDESFGEETLKLGAQDYVLKGQIDHQALLMRIRYAIERKHQEELVKRQAEANKHAFSELNQLFALVPSVIIRIDPDDRVNIWNNVAERVLGVTASKAVDHLLSECGIEWNYQILSKGISECRMRKISLRLEDITFKHQTGETGILGATLHPVIDTATQRCSILIFGADITERRRLESEYKEH